MRRPCRSADIPVCGFAGLSNRAKRIEEFADVGIRAPDRRIMESPQAKFGAHWDHEPSRKQAEKWGQKYGGIFFCPHSSDSRFMESRLSLCACIATMNPVGRVCPSEPASWNTLWGGSPGRTRPTLWFMESK